MSGKVTELQRQLVLALVQSGIEKMDLMREISMAYSHGEIRNNGDAARYRDGGSRPNNGEASTEENTLDMSDLPPVHHPTPLQEDGVCCKRAKRSEDGDDGSVDDLSEYEGGDGGENGAMSGDEYDEGEHEYNTSVDPNRPMSLKDELLR